MGKPLNPSMNRKMQAYGTSSLDPALTSSKTKPKQSGSGPSTATGAYSGQPKGVGTGGKGKLFRDSKF